jgi:hypothetical protein
MGYSQAKLPPLQVRATVSRGFEPYRRQLTWTNLSDTGIS